MNAPIRYFGGKGMMFNEIIKHFPVDYSIYIEPFGGSFSVGLKVDNPAPCEIYNDLDKNVYSLYKVLQDKVLFEQFKHKADLSIYSEDFRAEYKKLLQSAELSLLDRAFYFYYVNRTSHNGIGGFSIIPLERRKMSKSASDFLSCVDRLPELHQRLSKVVILNQDGIQLIKKYNTKNVFIYADPPYHWSTRTSTRYAVDMSSEQHQEFLDACISSDAKILISGYDNEFYNTLTDNGFEKVKFEVKTVDGNLNPKTKTEVLWKNF